MVGRWNNHGEGVLTMAEKNPRLRQHQNVVSNLMKYIFKIFNRHKVKHLYSDMKPGDRIAKLMVEFVFPQLEQKGFKYIKSTREFKKTNEFFDFHIGWYTRKFNHGNTIVEFDMYINLFSPKYRKWEMEFYNLEKNWGSSIDGTRVDYIEGWSKEFYNQGWYDLVKYDNAAVMKKVSENVMTAGFNFFEKYSTFDTAINELKRYHVKNFETIVDLYIIQDKYEEALDFFDKHNEWFEERLKSVQFEYHAQFVDNRKELYLQRKEKLKNWVQQRV